MIPVIVIITGMISKVAITTIKSRSRKKKRCNAEVFLSIFSPPVFMKERSVASFYFLVLLDIYLCVCLKED